jgi:hypothetical protein
MEKERITRFESGKDYTNRFDRLSVDGLSEDQDPDQSESKDCYDECHKEISMKVQKKYQKLKKTLIENNKTENILDLDYSSDFGKNQDHASRGTQALSPTKKYIIISEEFPDGEPDQPDSGQDKSPSIDTPGTRKSRSQLIITPIQFDSDSHSSEQLEKCPSLCIRDESFRVHPTNTRKIIEGIINRDSKPLSGSGKISRISEM